jgi:small-conductance mechanosensitive channel
MTRKILTGVLIGLSSIMLILSVAGIGAAWIYNEPLTREATARLQEVDSTLAQIQSDLLNAKAEVERALRIIDSAEQALASLAEQATDAKDILGSVTSTLDDQLIPGLKTTRDSISQVRGTLEELRATLDQVNSLPFVDLNIPGDELLADILSGMDSLDTGLADVQGLAQRASTFVSDTSYLLGGDFKDTKQHLLDLGLVLDDYDIQITNWRTQVGTLIESLPGWIDRASVILTVFLLWFGLSQFGLILHGLNLWKGGNPLEGWKKAFKRRKSGKA